MRKILLVDDETFVLEGIRSSLPWKELGIGEVFTAQNGIQAMEILMANTIDFMVTDIKMPVMDGIELIQQLHQRRSPCKVIVLSGFDNFKFAQEAVTYNVVEYLLKPITLSKLRSAIEKALSLALQEETSEKHLQVLEQQFEASRSVLSEHFISELLAGNLNYDLAELLRFNFSAIGYRVAVFHIDHFEGSEDIPLPLLETKRQLAVLDALHSVEKAVFPGADFLIVRVGSYDFALVLMIRKPADTARSRPSAPVPACEFGAPLEPIAEHLPEYLEELKAALSLDKPYTFSIGIGNIHRSPLDIARSYEEASDALKCKLFTGSGSIIAYSDLYKEQNAAFPQLTREKALVRNCLHTRDLQMLDTLLKDIQSQLIQAQAQDLDYIRQMAMEFILAATLFLYEKNELPQKVLCRYQNPVLYVSRLETIEDVFAVVQDVYCQVIAYLSCKSDLKNQHTLERIRAFVQENLSNDISLEMLSQHIQLTPNYIGALFKQSTNLYFSDYVMRERMERAKVLLENPVCRIYEVAAAVGYKNATYFSKVFKDYTGFNPTDFKK